MDAVKAFNAELSGLYDVKPPISKAKMNSLTRGAIKAIKFYKHVVQSVEKFIQKCKPEYKVPGLYVIDSIVRQSRHQFGTEKDVFAPRFAKNMQTTFLNLLKCPPEDKSKVIRVLNLWQKNAVFPPEVIQPLFDLVDPNHPIHKEQSNGNNISNLSAVSKTSPSTAKSTPKDLKLFTTAKPIDPAWLAQTKMETANIVNANKLLGQVSTNQMDVSFLDQLQHLQQLLLKKQEAANEASQSSVKFDKKLLDFDYGEEEDDDVQVTTSPKMNQSLMSHNAVTTATNNLESLGLLLTNPEVLRQLQTLQQTMQNSTNTLQHEMEEKMRKLQQMKQQEEEFDKHLAQTVPSLPFASECELKPTDIMKPAPPPPPPPPPVPYGSVVLNQVVMQQDMSQPPPGYHPPAMPFVSQPPPLLRAAQMTPIVVPHQSPRHDDNNSRRENSVEIVNCDSVRSQSRSPDRFRRHSRSRSPRHRDRDRGRDRDRSDRKSRSRSRSRRRRSRSRDRNDRKRDDSRDRFNDEEKEKERERRKRGLPPLMKDKLSVCSTTLWVGHLSKLVHQEELSDTFGEIGDIVSIDLISPRGCAFICMNRRQDAYKALTKLKNHKMQGKAITLAWAPGKGVKGKEWKDYWEVELGVSYIPWNKLHNITDQDLELLEEGGMIDEDTMPPKLKGKRKRMSESESSQSIMSNQVSLPSVGDGIVQVSTNAAPVPPLVDMSQPPPIRPPTQALLPPPNQLQMMPPGFTMPPGMLGPMGLSMPPGLMPNVPIGVPPPNMQGLIGPPGMMQSMMQNSPFGAGVGVGLLTQIPMPAPAAPSDKPNSTGMPHNVPPLGVPPPNSEPGMPNLPLMRQAYGVGPPMPMQQMPPQPPSQHQQRPQQPPLPHQQHPDDMDVEMEDAMIIPPIKESGNGANKAPSLSDQLLAAMKANSTDRLDNERDSFRDRERDRDRDRERDRDRDRRDRSDRGGGGGLGGDRCGGLSDRGGGGLGDRGGGLTDRGGGLGDRDRNDRNDVNDSRGRDRARGRDRGGRDRGRRDSRDNRDRDDRRSDRDRDSRDMRHSPMRQDILGQENDSLVKKEIGPKPSLADRLRQLADGTLPLMDDRMDRDMRSRSERAGDRIDRKYDEPSSRRPALDGPPPPPTQQQQQQQQQQQLQSSSLMASGRRPGEGPPSLLDLPAKFPGPPDRTDFGVPRDFGPRVESRDLREFSQRGPGLGDRDNRAFGLRRGGTLDDFPEPPRSLLERRFAPPEDFDARMGAGVGGGPPRPEVDFDMRHGPPPPPPPATARDADFDSVRGEVRGGPVVTGGPGSRLDEFERQQRFDFDMRQRNPSDGPFDHPRGLPDDYEMRDHPDFDMRARRDFFMEPKFGHPGMMGPRGPRGPLPPMMGDGYGPRGGRGHGPPMFHPRGMGPRGMRLPGMRPPFGGPVGPRGGPFDPRDGPDSPFFRPGAYDDSRGGPQNLGRPNMPPYVLGGSHPPPLMGNLPGDGPWRNEAGPPPPPPPPPQQPQHAGELGGEEVNDSRDKAKRAVSTDKDTRRRENRKSRWGNASPSAEQMDESYQPSMPEAFVNTEGDLANADPPNSKEDVDVVTASVTHEASAYPPPPQNMWSEPQQMHEEPLKDVAMKPLETSEQPIEQNIERTQPMQPLEKSQDIYGSQGEYEVCYNKVNERPPSEERTSPSPVHQHTKVPSAALDRIEETTLPKAIVEDQSHHHHHHHHHHHQQQQQPPLPPQEHLEPQLQEHLELSQPPPPPQEEFEPVVEGREQYQESESQQEALVETRYQDPMNEPTTAHEQPAQQIEEEQQQEQEVTSESAES